MTFASSPDPKARERDTHAGFLSAILGVAEAITLTDLDRVTQIGTGDVELSERIIIRRQPDSCIYVHRWRRSDPDDLHDHPWDWCSIVLSVGYFEHTEIPGGGRRRTWRQPGSVVFRKAEERHKVEIDESARLKPVSLFITSVERREWGFWRDGIFIVGREYRSVEAFRKRRDG